MKILCHLCGSVISGNVKIGGMVELDNHGGFFLCSLCCALPYFPFDRSYKRIGKVEICIGGNEND